MRYNWPLIGHQQIKDYFKRTFTAGCIHHAYLLQGPGQVGKATFAKLLAKTLLCEINHPQPACAGRPLLEKEGKPLIPCSACRACVAFDHGAHPDVLTLEKGEDTSIGIEKAREFISGISLRPLLGSWRIGMIEGAAELTKDAANALLKTLEEPPARVVLFLVSGVELLPTITSRCQRIRFGFVPTAEIEEYLITRRATGVGVDAREIAQLAAGRPGRAIELLQPDLYEARMKELTQANELLDQSEAKRLIYAVERFGGKGDLAEKRAECLAFIEVLQHVLRQRIRPDKGFISMLKKTFEARSYLKANVDPKLVMECLLFS